ncbi:hypothetical protein [Tenacibaculum caenipelagi]|uniref:HEAT repeat protein n=1 Tax=Tenacibaculum caenipelagi TaxID=1325435 RepID=A0A4R6TCJ5_9FLAO|nr:hypothetical protein [Tenacibaculum caenipelagi]TDQ22657.1 hypothetical protein DFQ07_2674 [Tenacibaculum caenipelagi]
MKYESYNFQSKEEVNELLSSNNNDEIISALVGAINGIEDRVFLEDICCRFVNHEDFWVSKTAISSLGDIARIYKFIDLEKIIPILQKNKRENLKPVIDEVISDIKIFTKGNSYEC